MDDLAPQLAEFELRCQGGDYDTAAQVLLGIDVDYLIQWGHYRLTAELHQQLQGHLDDPWTNADGKTNLGELLLVARPDRPGHRPVRAGAGPRPGDRRPAA